MGLSISAGTSDHQSSLEWDPKKLPGGTGRGCTAAVMNRGAEPLTHLWGSNDPARLGCRIRNGMGCVPREQTRPASCS